MKYLLSILLVAMLLIPVSISSAATIPTFTIVSVVPDTSVTIQASNFPAGYTFTARMGAFGTLGVNGTVAGTTDSGKGGSFQATYNIPAALKGSSRIAIRLESTTGGFFAYNWFFNSTSGSAPAPSTTPAAPGLPNTGYSGIPTFDITSVTADDKVSIVTHNFPAGYTFTARIGKNGTLGVNGTVVGTTESGAGGSFSATYTIPAALKGSTRLSIRLESTKGGFFAYNWFDNKTASSAPNPTTTPAPTGVPGTGSNVFPSFTIDSVVKDTSVTIKTKNFPANTTFTARMGKIGTLGVNGTVVGTSDSASGGVYTVTFNIPAGLKGASQIAIRLEAPGGYFAYNWFYNSTYP
jgi:hypothetical protein